jgi:hypothetical protein
MWVWPQAAFSTEASREKLLAFCAAEGITHLDQHVGIENENAVRSLKDAKALAAPVVSAREKGITVNALRGSPDMFFSRNHEKTLDDLRAIIAFDKHLPATARLAGVKYDAEPHGAEEWEAGGEQRVEIIVARITRDPRRKLGWDDRLVGAMRVVMGQGIAPRRFAAGAAAAIEMLALETGDTVESLLNSLWPGTDAVERWRVVELIASARGASKTAFRPRSG